MLSDVFHSLTTILSDVFRMLKCMDGWHILHYYLSFQTKWQFELLLVLINELGLPQWSVSASISVGGTVKVYQK